MALANALNSQVANANSGATNTFTVSNTSDTASSAANIIASVGGSSAGDATHQAVVTGVTTWTWGVDNSDSDAWVLAASAALGTTNVMRSTTAGEITMPLQSAFLAYLSSTAVNASGDGTLFPVIADTEVFDQNSDYNNATGVYEAPVTSRVTLNVNCFWFSGTAITNMTMQISTSNRIYQTQIDLAALGGGTEQGGNFSMLCDMDAGDTATFITGTTDTGGKIDDLLGSATVRTAFSGYIAC